MEKIYFAGKFNLLKDSDLTLEQKLVNDFRSKLLGDSKLLSNYQENLIINNSYQYLGPFYCEQASQGDFTSTDCNVVLNAESDALKKCDVYVGVFGESFSVGTIVELGWALNMNKKIVILYKEEESQYQIKSEYWFAIADALARSKNIEVFKYKDEDEIVEILKEYLEGRSQLK